MFEGLKKNIAQEKKILTDLKSIFYSMQDDMANQQFYLNSINSLLKQIYLLNAAVPEHLKEWSPVLNNVPPAAPPVQTPPPVQPVVQAPPVAQPLTQTPAPPAALPVQPKTVNVSYVSPAKQEKHYISINKKDRKEYLKSLHLSETNLLKMDKDVKKETETDDLALRKPSGYAKISNRMFRDYSEKIAPSFASLDVDIKKGNLTFLLSTYLSMAMFTAMLGFIGGFILYIVLIIFSLSNWIHLWIPFAAVVFVFMGFYLYPSSEAGSVQKKIAYELPFVTIHMAAVAGSDIEPTKIFKIIASSKEYPNIGNEMRKVIVQTEIYGYDLVTALKNVSLRTGSKKLAEMFSGLATNISTGGQLKNFLEKKAENYLLDYRLERQKYSDLAGTFMDVYISILIAAPLVLMMLLIVMYATGMDLGGLPITFLLLLAIVGVSIVNVLFLVVLNMKQPKV